MNRSVRSLPFLLVISLSLGVLSCDLLDTTDFGSDDFGDAIDVGASLSQAMEASSTDLSEDPDPAVQSAGESATAADRERKEEAEDEDNPFALDKIADLIEKAPLGNDPEPSGDSSSSGGSDASSNGSGPSAGGNVPSPGAIDIDAADGAQPELAPVTPQEARQRVEENPVNFYRWFDQAAAEVAAGESPKGAKAAALYLMEKFSPRDVDPQTEYIFTYMSVLNVRLKGLDPGTPEHQRLSAEFCAQEKLWETTTGESFRFRRTDSC